MSKKMRHLTHSLLYATVYGAAVVVICVAIILQAARLLTPYIHHAIPSIEKAIGAYTQTRISIGHIEGRWTGMRPRFVIDDIALHNIRPPSESPPEQKLPLKIQHAEIAIDLMASLFRREWVWDKLALRDADINVAQNHEQQWLLAGWVLSSHEGSSDWSYDDLVRWSTFVPDINVDNVSLQAIDANGVTVDIAFPAMRTESSPNNQFQRLTASAVINGQPAIEFAFERYGDASIHSQAVAVNARAHLSFSDLSLGDISLFTRAVLPSTIASYLQHDPALLDSQLSGSLWLDVLPDEQIAITAVSESFIRSRYVNGDKPMAINVQLGGVIDDLGQAHIGVDQLLINRQPLFGDVMLAADVNDVMLRLEKLSLQPLMSWVNASLLLPENISDALNTLSPTGELRAIQIDATIGAEKPFELQLEAEKLSFNAMEKIPALSNVSGFIRVEGLSGFINIDAQDLGFWPEQIYDEPLIFDQLSGQVAWLVDSDTRSLLINSGVLKGIADFGDAGGEFLLEIPLDEGTRNSEFTLNVGLTNSQARYHRLLTPNKVPEDVRDWLAQSIKAGTVEQAGFIYRGGFSGDDNTRSFQLLVDASNVDMQFSQDWPALTQVDGQVFIDNQAVSVSTQQAYLFDEAMDSLSVWWPGDGQRQLNIRSKTNLSAATGLRLLTETPLQKRVGNVFEGVSATGDIHTAIDVWVPVDETHSPVDVDQKKDKQIGNRFEPAQAGTQSQLAAMSTTVVSSSSEYLQHVTVDFLSNDLRIPLVSSLPNLPVSQLVGQLSFSSDSGITAPQLTMKVLEDPLTINIQTQQQSPLAKKQLVINGKGVASVDAIYQWINLPEHGLIKGVTPYEFTLNTRFNLDEESSDDRSKGVNITVSSTLKGLSIDLPEPFKKAAAATEPLVLTVKKEQALSEYSLTLGEFFSTQLSQKTDTASGFLTINNALAAPVADDVFAVSAKLDRLDIPEWMTVKKKLDNVINRNQPSRMLGDIRVLYDVSVTSLFTDKHTINDLSLSGEYAQSQWRTQVSHRHVEGELTIHDDPKIANNVHLYSLKIPRSPPVDQPQKAPDKKLVNKRTSEDLLADVDFSWLKPTDVTINQLQYGEAMLGQWRLMINPMPDGIEMNNIYAVSGKMRLQGEAAAQGARLFWQRSTSQTSFRGQLSGQDVGVLFEYLGAPPLLESQTMRFDADVVWSGSPAAFSVDNMSGTLDVALSDGVFKQSASPNTSGILRLLGLFNFNTWARRIRLDFSDLYKKGLAYDELTTRLLFDKNNMYFQQPLLVKAPSSEFTMAGKIDTAEEKIDAVLVTTLPVGGNLTFATALVAGLPAAAGVYIFNKIFKSQVDKVSSLTYLVKGGWNDPTLEFINIFDNDPYVSDVKGRDARLNEQGLN